MRPIAQWGHLMSSSVTVQPRTTKDAYGKPTYGTAVSYQAHVQKDAELTPSASAAGIVEAVQVYISGTDPIQPTALLTLSTSDVGSTESFERQPRILGVKRRFDQKGAHHVVLYAGWAPRSA